MTRLNRWLVILLAAQLAALLAVWLVPRGSPAEKPRKLLEGKIEASAVTGIRIVSNEGKSAVLKKQGGNWVLASGGDYPVLGNKVSELLGKLPGLMAAGSPVTSKPEHHRALEVGGDTFQRDVRITQAGKPELHFYLGSSAGLKDVHFRMDGENAVYLAKDLSAWDLGTVAADWVASEYLKIDRESIVGLHIQNPEGAIELSKTDGKWALTDLTEESKLKDGEVDSLVSAISGVTLQEPVGTKLEPAQGLDKPAATVTVLVKVAKKDDGKKADEKAAGEKKTDLENEAAVPSARRLFIGAKSGDAYFAKSETSPFVVKLSSWTAETFLKKKKADLEEKEKKEGDKKDEGAMAAPPMGEGGEP